MKTMLPGMLHRNDRNSIRITRKIKNRQRESSFDMNVSLAREESKASFIQRFNFFILWSRIGIDRDASEWVVMKPWKTQYKKTMAWLIFVSLVIIFGIVLALSVNMKVKPAKGSMIFSDFFRNFSPLLEIIEPIKRGKNWSKSQN